MKFSFNPDFSDVPPDNAQDVYNNDIPTMYSENRFSSLRIWMPLGLESVFIPEISINRLSPTRQRAMSALPDGEYWGQKMKK